MLEDPRSWQDSRAVVLVEGESDRAALLTLARTAGRDLAAERVLVLPLGGATNVVRVLSALRATAYDGVVAGLYDEAEERWFRRGLQRAGHGPVRDRDDLEDRGFFACVRDLEDELIRALGVAAVHRVVEEHGEVASLHTLQQQPAQRGRSAEEHLHRFLGTRSGRKSLYAELLVEALPQGAGPRPLVEVLGRV